MHAPRWHRPKGFTLIDLLVLIAVLGFFLAVCLMSVHRARSTAARADCQNNLRQLVLGAINCADTYRGRLPPLAGTYPDQKSTGTVFFHMLPFVEQQQLYQATFDGKSYSVWRARTSRKSVAIFVCPDDETRPQGGRYKDWLATSSYAGNFLIFGDPATRRLQGMAKFPASIQDGTSQTIMFTERLQVCHGTPCGWGYAALNYPAPMFAYYSQARFQVQPTPADCDPALAQSPHASGINVGMADGSARVVSRDISPETWWHACTPNGNDIIGDDW
jgi:prepilin-type processing-associated H-X9-DG protein